MKRLFFAIALTSGMFLACRNAEKKPEISEVNSKEAQTIADNEPAQSIISAEAISSDTTAVTAFTPPTQTPVVADPNWDKKIIKNANVMLEVKNHENYSQYIRNTVRKYGGYISKEENNVSDEKAETVMSIKVPVLQFESLMNDLAANDTKQLQRNITSEDVTSSIIDTKARLETKKATRSKYLEFLKQAGKVEDVLKVQQEINGIQEDIESAETRLAQLSGEAKFSTIHLVYFEPKSGYNPGNNKPGFGKRIVAAFSDGGSFFADIFIGLLTIWPLWLAGIIIGLFIYKRRKRAYVPGSQE